MSNTQIDSPSGVGVASESNGGEMSKRLTLAMSTVLATCLVTTFLNTTSQGAANDCLGTPGAAAPDGRHWYYRADRATGKKCWYLGAKDKKAQQTAPRIPLPFDRPAAPPAEKPPQTKAGPSDVAMPLSTRWPNLPASIDIVRPVSMNNSYAEEPASADAQDDMPLVWPVLTAAELAAAETSPTASIRAEHLLALLAGALGLSGILMGLVYALASIRRRRRHSHRWALASNDRPLHPLDNAGHPQTDSFREDLAARRAADLDRALRQTRLEFEERLRELIDARRRRAA